MPLNQRSLLLCDIQVHIPNYSIVVRQFLSLRLVVERVQLIKQLTS